MFPSFKFERFMCCTDQLPEPSATTVNGPSEWPPRPSSTVRFTVAFGSVVPEADASVQAEAPKKRTRRTAAKTEESPADAPDKAADEAKE